jgi:uncharacterized protein (TIGR03435 family)
MEMRRFVATTVVALAGAMWLEGGNESRMHAQNVRPPAFEVASVKPNRSGDGKVALFFQPGGRFNAIGVTLKMLIGAAYGNPQPLMNLQIIGGPRWIDSDRFDVVAKAEGDQQPGSNGPPTEMFAMLRTLLADRFKLVVHNESRELPTYALVLARDDGKRGPQLNPAAVDCAALRGRGGAQPPLPAPGERLPCGIRIAPGNLVGGGMGLQQLANALSRMPALNRLVVDRTGLTGTFDFDLKWTPDQIPPPTPGGPPPGLPPLPPIDPDGPSLFAALQEQLGLRLESTKGPVEVVVIDVAEPPTED